MDFSIICWDNWHLTAEVDTTDACDDENWDGCGKHSVGELFITAVSWDNNSLCLCLIWSVIPVILTIYKHQNEKSLFDIDYIHFTSDIDHLQSPKREIIVWHWLHSLHIVSDQKMSKYVSFVKTEKLCFYFLNKDKQFITMQTRALMKPAATCIEEHMLQLNMLTMKCFYEQIQNSW